ncbi:hypothetical protein MHYP_G00289550 [Metynnis hypsauchen]
MPDTRENSKANPDANATSDRRPDQDVILQAIADLRTVLLSKAEAQSAEIQKQKTLCLDWLPLLDRAHRMLRKRPAKLRAGFGEVRNMLQCCEGIQYGLWYPAELRIMLGNGECSRFKDPKLAKDFIQNLKLKP